MESITRVVTVCLLAIGSVGCASISASHHAQERMDEVLRQDEVQRARALAERVASEHRNAMERREAQAEPQVRVDDIQKAVDITPLSDYNDDWSAGNGNGADFSNAYTRLLILSKVSDTPGEESQDNRDKNGSREKKVEPMSYESRRWISRIFVERNYSINLTAKVSAGSFEATVPLATISHQSGAQGEKWGRNIYHTRQSFPLFLVPASGSASSPTVRVMVNGDRGYTSNAASTAVQVAINVAQLTGQTNQVITTLSADGARNQARALDQAISKLFGASLSEEHWSDRDLRFWSVDEKRRPRGVRVKFKVPSDAKDWNSVPWDVGEWTITFDYPRPSVFADWRICPVGVGDSLPPRCAQTREDALTRVYKSISPGEVLNYPLSPGGQGLGTIRAYLVQKEWFASSQAALANPARQSSAASALCRLIVNEITGIGLNGTDADIVVWAVVNGMPIENVKALQTNSDCKKSIDPVQLGRK